MHAIHHIAIIGSNYDRSRRFYHEVLGFPIIREIYREERASWKCDLDAGNAQIELFSFPSP
ncbi:VOC family protein, partial [Novosphingobium sp. ZW T3_23]|uniref:VOC family protein n=1 Tax=Novosphingobium sp. ZW T3_23 TaxID=3378084 RepID=UPI003854F378